MKFAFCLLKYFPFGGQQKNFLKIAEICMSRGHQVDVYTTSWQGYIPENLNVNVLPVNGITNHKRCESLARKLNRITSTNPYDAVVGFTKMPGLDVYYAADTCYAAKARERNIFYRWTAHCRSYLQLEKAVFDRKSESEILLLSKREKAVFKKFYKTPNHRFHLLPPGISKKSLAPANPAEIRNELRRELAISPQTNVVLLAGSGFKTKGVDRAIRAISALPPELGKQTVLLIVGQGKTLPFRWLAWRLGVADRVRFLQGREDILRFFVSADLLLHPAYQENTGTVLIEAMAAGLPVLATDVCGYSFHIQRAAAGVIIPSPFEQNMLNHCLLNMLTSDQKEQWQQNGKAYVANTDVFSRAEKAADIIENVTGRRNRDKALKSSRLRQA
ncbi:MAG: glycosyltransferase family 4 protein [Deltaproteobacteria bacterium]|nr:MAG: glycosyltransferase family 4 protein [Deltaproteobacteria bacterium]